MSNEENTEQQTVDSTKQQTVNSAKQQTADAAAKLNNIISLALQLKEKNPKVFFGAIGVVVILLILMMSGGDEPKLVQGPTIKNLAVGQKYVLKSANAVDPSSTIRLVSVPGSMQAFDDTEEADRNTPCQHMPQGTPVSVVELQDVPGAKFVKVQIETGECKGKDGWVLAIDVQ